MARATSKPQIGNLENALATAAHVGGQSLIACGEIIAITLAPRPPVPKRDRTVIEEPGRSTRRRTASQLVGRR